MLRGAVGKPVAWVLPSELAELADPRSLRQSLHIWGHQPWTGFVPLYALNLQGE